jgi:hypothetical protein
MVGYTQDFEDWFPDCNSPNRIRQDEHARPAFSAPYAESVGNISCKFHAELCNRGTASQVEEKH